MSKLYFYLVEFKVLLLLIVSLLFFSCKDKNETKINFYVTKTNFSLSKKEKLVLEQNKSEKLYINFYTIKIKQNKTYPTYIIIGDNLPENKKNIPVIKIDYEVLEELKYKNIDTLVNRIAQLNNQIYKIKRIKPLEVLIDYNWNLATKDNYFYFIEKLSKLSNQKISIFVRPNQLKYNQKEISNNVSSGVFIFSNENNFIKNELFNKNSVLNKELKNTNYIDKLLIPSLFLYHKKNKNLTCIPISFLNKPKDEIDENLKKINSELFIFKRNFKFNKLLIKQKDSLILKKINPIFKKKLLSFLVKNHKLNEIIFKEIN
ncbi:MAG: hypothetical protein ACEQSF_03485 [Solirubrobacteraceae bacterium]